MSAQNRAEDPEIRLEMLSLPPLLFDQNHFLIIENIQSIVLRTS